MSMRIYFRGDTRHPITDKIFQNGMESRDYRKPADQRKALPELLESGDADRESGVAVTRNPYSAAEQYSGAPEKKWIYFLALGDALRPNSNDFKIIETHKHQVMRYLDGSKRTTTMFWYAEEFVTKKIPGYDIIAAMEIKLSKEYVKDYDFEDWKKFTVQEHLINSACLVPALWRKPAINIMLELFHIGSTHDIPKMLDGIVTSNRKNDSIHPTILELMQSWET